MFNYLRELSAQHVDTSTKLSNNSAAAMKQAFREFLSGSPTTAIVAKRSLTGDIYLCVLVSGVWQRKDMVTHKGMQNAMVDVQNSLNDLRIYLSVVTSDKFIGLQKDSDGDWYFT